MFKKNIKWIMPLIIFTTIFSFLCTEYKTINFVTECEKITQISSPFEQAKNNSRQIRRIMRSLNMIILTENAPEQSTKEVVYQILLHSKSGHTEKIISYRERLLHYDDGQCIGEYYEIG